MLSYLVGLCQCKVVPVTPLNTLVDAFYEGIAL